MATSTYGTPYVESGDLVSNWPTTSQSVADRVDDVSIKGNGVNTQTGTTYTTVLTDAGKTVTLDNAAAVAVTIPPNASVAYETGTQIKFLNLGAGTVTLGPGSGVTLNGDTLTADQYIGLAAIKVDTDEWVVLPFSGGVGSAQISDTPTGSYSGYEYWTYTASGTLTVTKAGYVDCLVIGAGGGGGRGNNSNTGAGGGGAGSYLDVINAFLPAGSHTVVVGAGGAAAGTNDFASNNGEASRLGSYYAPGGGFGISYQGTAGGNGGSGGGGGCLGNATVLNGGTGTSGTGNNGGNAHGSTSTNQQAGGGGGGAGAAGANASANTGGNGGVGLASSITGSSVTRAAGGGGCTPVSGTQGTGGSGGGGDGGGSPTSGAVNTGSGGGAGNGVTPGSGGSGIVIVRVAV